MEKLSRQLDPLGLRKDQLLSLYRCFMSPQGTKAELPIESFCSELSKITRIEPSKLRTTFARMTNSEKISWDRFLELLHNDSILRSTVLNQRIAPQIPLQITEVEPQQEFNKELKNTNKEVRKIQDVTVQSYLFQLILTDNELIFIDKTDMKVAIRLAFSARYIKPQPRKLSNISTINNNSSHTAKDPIFNTQVEFSSGILTNNIKKSIRLVSTEVEEKRAVSGRKSMTQSVFSVRKSSIKKKYERIKRSNIDQIFNLFKELPSDKSVELCKLYTESEQPEFIIDKTFATYLDKKPTINLPSSAHRTNWRQTLEGMRKDKERLQLDPRRGLSFDFPSASGSSTQIKLTKEPRLVRDKATALQNTAKKKNVHIQSYSIYKEFMAVSLATKELRIVKLKKYFFNKVITEELYSKFYPQPPLFVHIFESKIQIGQLFFLFAIEEDDKVYVRVKHFHQTEGFKETIYSYTIKYFPIFDVIDPLGIAIFNERGMFNFLELNSLQTKDLTFMRHSSQFYNPQTEKKIPISVVRYHKPTMRLIAGCLDGFVYSISYIDLELKRLKRITQKNVQCIEINDRQNYFMVVCSDNKIRLLHGDTLEVFCLVDLSQSGINANRGLYSKGQNWFYVYGLNVAKVEVKSDFDKISKIHRDKCTHKERIRMFTDEQAKQITNDLKTDTVSKVWISYNMLIVLFDSGLVNVLLPNKEKIQFYIINPNRIVAMCVCSKSILFAQAFQDFQVEVRNMHTQQIVLTYKLEGLTCMIFLSPNMRHLFCLANNKGECFLINPTGPRQRPHTQQTIVNTNSRTQITSIVVIKNQLIIGNQKGQLLIFTKNLYSLRVSLKLQLNGYTSRIKNISIADDQAIIVRTLHPGLFKVDVLDGRVLWSTTIQAEPQFIISDYRQKIICKKSNNEAKVFSIETGKELFRINLQKLNLQDIFSCKFLRSDLLSVISSNGKIRLLQFQEGQWSLNDLT